MMQPSVKEKMGLEKAFTCNPFGAVDDSVDFGREVTTNCIFAVVPKSIATNGCATCERKVPEIKLRACMHVEIK